MMAPFYAACPPFRLVALDGLSVIYHRASGATHIVSEPVPQIFAALGTDALGAGQLLDRLKKRFDIADGTDELAARLDELVGLGLVVRT